MSASVDRAVPKGGLIAVTGGSGWIAGYIIHQLLDKGYKVRAIVRNIKNTDKVKHLINHPKKEGQLEIVEADIESGKYGTVLAGCDALIHTATPYVHTAPDPQKDIIDPAVKGTVDAIKAAIEQKLKRVVVTSSGGSIMHFPVEANYVFGEKDWNTTSSLTDNPYFYSKKLAEEAAWKIWEDHKNEIDLVVVNPLYVLGAPQSDQLNTSLKLLLSYMTGQNKNLLPGWVGFVHVNDVATGHLIGLEHPKAVGRRIICCSETHSWKKMGDRLKELYPDYPVTQADKPVGIPVSFDNSLSKELGLKEYVNFDGILKDSVEGLIKVGALEDKRKK